MTYPKPLVLYKYAPPADYVQQILTGESLKFACPLDLNDPFECQPCFRFEGAPQSLEFIKEGAKRFGVSPAKRLQVNDRIKRLSGKTLPNHFFPGINDLIREVGICCFSEVRDSILMWAHYASDHSGVCIGFDTRKSLFQVAWEVTYQEALPVLVRPKDSSGEMLNKSLLTKSCCWSYEKEWRIVRRTLSPEEVAHYGHKYRDVPDREIFTVQRGPGLYSFDKGAIKEVILGVKTSKDYAKQVRQWVEEANLSVPVFQMKRHPTAFILVPEQIYRPLPAGGRIGEGR